MIFTKKPYLVSFAGNPMRYLLSSGGGGGGGEVLSIIEITFTDVDSTEGHSIDIDFLSATRTFTLKTAPALTDDLPAASQEMTPTLWCAAVYAWLLDDVQLRDYYDISIDGAVITLTARTGSPDYDWTASNNTIVGVAFATTQNGAAATAWDVDGVKMQVWKNGTVKIAEEYKPLMSDGTVKFEIQEYIYASLLQALPPRFRLTGAQYFHNVYTDGFLKYRTVFCDKIDGAFSWRTYIDPDHLFCYGLPGGLNREDLVANNNANVDWFNLAATQKKFLTWAPPSRLTDKFETHSLFFAFQAPAHNTFQYMIEVVTTEGSQAPIQLTGNTSIAYWSVVEFMAGYAQLGVEALATGHGEVVSWKLYLVDANDNRISDIREFVLDQKYAENTRYFRFRNSWGAYDSLRCIGNVESTVEHDRERVSFISDETETEFNAPSSYSLISETQNFKANTGWLQKTFLNYLRDFMLSTDIYEIDDSRLLKCMLTSKKTNLFKDGYYNYNLVFEYERGYSDFFFQGLD